MNIDPTTIAKTSTYAGSGGAIYSGLTLNDVGVLIGIATALIGLGLQLFFGAAKRREEREAHQAHMAALRARSMLELQVRE